MLSAIFVVFPQLYRLIDDIGIIRSWVEAKENPGVLSSPRKGLGFDDVVNLMAVGLRGLDQRFDHTAGLEVEAGVVGLGVFLTALLRGVYVDNRVRRSDRRFDVDDRPRADKRHTALKSQKIGNWSFLFIKGA